jgi:hypothetical protein
VVRLSPQFVHGHPALARPRCFYAGRSLGCPPSSVKAPASSSLLTWSRSLRDSTGSADSTASSMAVSAAPMRVATNSCSVAAREISIGTGERILSGLIAATSALVLRILARTGSRTPTFSASRCTTCKSLSVSQEADQHLLKGLVGVEAPVEDGPPANSSEHLRSDTVVPAQDRGFVGASLPTQPPVVARWPTLSRAFQQPNNEVTHAVPRLDGASVHEPSDSLAI